MIHGGVDLVYVPRIARLVTRYHTRFLIKVFTVSERAYYGQIPVQSARLAGCWAAKEAVIKALGVGWRGVGYHDVEILAQSGKAPQLKLHGQAALLGAGWQWSLSISHDGDYATAVAFAQSPM
jgi:holo-[acyl-carrier protein] synthase